MEPSRTSEKKMEKQGLQLGGKEQDGKNKLARKSDNITMIPARESRNTTSTNTNREQSAPKKTRCERKQGLLKFFRDGARVPPPSTEGTPMDAAKMRRNSATGTSGSKNKRDSIDGKEVISSKKSKSDDEESHGEVADLEKMEETPLKLKGTRSRSKKGSTKKDKAKKTPESRRKKTSFAETVGKEVVKEKEVEYKKCVVGFAIRVNKTKDTKGGFDKKLNKGLIFMQTYIDQHASFHPINPGAALKPIKEKGDFPKFQVTSRSYFCVPSSQAFDNINAEAG
jgi:hypothetical protein